MEKRGVCLVGLLRRTRFVIELIHQNYPSHGYQGPFKSFPVADDGHFFVVCRYVERNPLRASSDLVFLARNFSRSGFFCTVRIVPGNT